MTQPTVIVYRSKGEQVMDELMWSNVGGTPCFVWLAGVFLLVVTGFLLFGGKRRKR